MGFSRSWFPGRTSTATPARRSASSRAARYSWLARSPLKVRSPAKISTSGPRRSIWAQKASVSSQMRSMTLPSE